MSLIKKNEQLAQRCSALEKHYRQLEYKFSYLENKLTNQKQIIHYLYSNIKNGEKLKEISDIEWLIENKLERMDASEQQLFEKTRAAFHLDRYEFSKSYVENKIVGDIACGTGYGTDLLSSNKAKHITGIDISLDAINYAKKYHKHDNNDFLCSSAHTTPLNNNDLDVLISFETLEHLENEDELLNEFKRILKKDGTLIISTPNDWGVDELSPHHVRSYDYFTLLDTLNKYFVVEKVYNQNSGTPNREENFGQPRGIIETSDSNHQTAECFIAICKNIRK